MRDTTRHLTEYYVNELDLRGDVLEIGGHRLATCAVDLFPPARFTYTDLNIEPSDIPSTVIADVTDCRDVIDDESYDVVFTSDVFEHIDRPWLAAQEISRILRPGGIAIVWTLWAWRNHPCPIDYWRFSPPCLEFLFDDLVTVESGFDLSRRRWNTPGFWSSGNDSVPVDRLGGWRENWAVYCVLTKGDKKQITAFKDTRNPDAQWLRKDTQGTVTSPSMLGSGSLPSPERWDARLAQIATQLEKAEVTTEVGLLRSQISELTDAVNRLQSAPPPPTSMDRAVHYAKAVRRRVLNGFQRR